MYCSKKKKYFILFFHNVLNLLDISSIVIVSDFKVIEK